MSSNIPAKKKLLYKDRRKGERRKVIRRSEDRALEQGYRGKVRKLQFLVELGQLIGLDLN
jgi:hypothetical protein